jgi:hypothetical protein
MDKQNIASSNQVNSAVPAPEKPAGLAREHGPTRHERMPFTVRIAYTDEELYKAVKIRQSAYGRHLPELASQMNEPETTDRDAGAVVLLAESKLDGSPLGTMRIQTNRYRPLGVEQSVHLPAEYQNCVLAEVTRLGVTGGIRGSVVKTMLFKALYLYCKQEAVQKIIIVARAPLDKQYEALLFEDVFGDKPYLPMSHVGNIPHRVMVCDVPSAWARGEAANHPLVNFFFLTEHADVDLRQPAPQWAAQPANGLDLVPEVHAGVIRRRTV